MFEISTVAPWFIAAVSLVLMIVFAIGLLRGNRADHRLNALSQRGSSTILSSYGSSSHLSQIASRTGRSTTSGAGGSMVSMRLRKEKKRKELRDKLTQAGLYSPESARVFAVVRLISFVVPLTIGFVAYRMGFMSMTNGILIGVILGLTGVVAPTFWLDYVKASRQAKIRKALPDALDLISVCIEAGLSLSAAVSRVSRELATAHPTLGLELAIVERQTQMGRSSGQALREFGERFDLEELRSLASVVTHAERYGTSVTKALAVYADTLRTKRRQRAEENAQKAVIKMLFPTLFLIFPGIFIVVLGPAMIQIYNVLLKQLLGNSPQIPF